MQRRLPKASDVLAEDLRREILGRALVAGSALPSESELVARYGLSRASVREGLRLLEADGLISIKRGPRGGIFVQAPQPNHVSRSLALLLTLSEAPLRDLFQFRKLVEPEAAYLAAEYGTAEKHALLLAATEQDHEGSTQERVDFHAALARACGNEVLNLVLSALENVLLWHAGEEMFTDTELRETALIHRRIANAVSNRDGDKARTLMLRHIIRFEEAMRKAGRLDEPIVPRPRW
jgi:GntR family transcriptional repressor for pyruvate dehydrogenase complex